MELFDGLVQPVPEELQNGPGFGYVVAFRPHGATGWMQAAVPSAEASRYVFKNESIQPFSPFHVKVGVYNNEGEGPFGPVTTIYSAEEGVCYLLVLPVWRLPPWNEYSSSVELCFFRNHSIRVFSAEPGRAPTRVRTKSLSASEVEVSWKALPWSVSKKRVLGYEVSYSTIKACYLCSYSSILSVCWCTSTSLPWDWILFSSIIDWWCRLMLLGHRR